MIQKFYLQGIYPKREWKHWLKKTYTLIFMAALFTTAKIGKHPKCLCTDDKENATHTHAWTSAIKQDLAIFNSMDGPWGGLYARWSKSEIAKYGVSPICTIKKIQLTDAENRSVVARGGVWVWMKWVERVNKKKFQLWNKSWGYNVHHGEYS